MVGPAYSTRDPSGAHNLASMPQIRSRTKIRQRR